MDFSLWKIEYRQAHQSTRFTKNISLEFWEEFICTQDVGSGENGGKFVDWKIG